MPRIFDNIEQEMLGALTQTLGVAERADFCVGYFNLRGWKRIDCFIDGWDGTPRNRCRLLVGMHRLPQEQLREHMAIVARDGDLDNATALRLRRQLAEEFRLQLAWGAPTNEDEAGLRRLAAQIKAGKVVVKLFLRHPLHAKLYLLHRPDPVNPSIGFVGSSNLTLAGLSGQGELNVDVMDHDACAKLRAWFDARWDDRWCVDISQDLVEIIEESWAREALIPPYHIYIKMAYHLSQEARAGLAEFRIPTDFGNTLFEYQKAAVKIAAHHLNKRGGVLLGDVVGLGKTLMATAVARVFEDDYGLETLIICPKNLVPMWEDYRQRYRMRATVLSITRAQTELPKMRRFRIVILDESHNLRNREGRRYRAIADYIRANESRCILLSATPYNKTYVDLSNQLRLFVPEGQELSIKPERLLRELGETEFIRRYQCPVRSIAAFEKSAYADDWRELMRLYLVRRTRTFIQDNYADTDRATGRKYLTFPDGRRSYFPRRVPKTLRFQINDRGAKDQYGRLFAPNVVKAINELKLPRYGLGNYAAPVPHDPPTPLEDKILADLSRGGRRLMGFCRTNLFKRLESGGHSFIQSIERHILRNHVYLHAIANNLPLPIGTQDPAMLDPRAVDEDYEVVDSREDLFANEEDVDVPVRALRTKRDFQERAASVYATYAGPQQRRFRWLRPALFVTALAADLEADAASLLTILEACGHWDASRDAKLAELVRLLTSVHADEKVLIFTQFADTVHYLADSLNQRGVKSVVGVTGDSENPTALAWRFSPVSSNKRDEIDATDEIRVLIATDVLSEGQNLQDAAIVVNYDLPWAIIRLIQRAGRVDRIGQRADAILCYTFLPADGVERIIRLRARVRQRLHDNAEVIGTDESFFDDDKNDQAIVDLYHEKAGILDGDEDTEVDLASYAYQIWKNATDADPNLHKVIPELPPVVFSTRAHEATKEAPAGALVYVRTGEGNDALAWVDTEGQSVTESQFAILRAAACEPGTPALRRLTNHHELVQIAVARLASESQTLGGQLGRPSGARFRSYERLKRYAESIKGTIWETDELHRAIEDIYRAPLREAATDLLNRQLKSGASDPQLAELVINLRGEDRLTVASDEEIREPQIICSMGLSAAEG